MTILRFACCIGIVFFCALSVRAQEIEFSPYHRVTLALSHAYIPSGINDDGRNTLALPAFSFDYDYWFARNWAIGLHSDLILENFLVETIEKKEIERNRPVAIALAAVFRPGDHLSFLLGSGTEIAEEGSLFLVRLGTEYGWEISEEWELELSLMYDAKWDSYNTWVLGLGVSRIFRKSDKER